MAPAKNDQPCEAHAQKFEEGDKRMNRLEEKYDGLDVLMRGDGKELGVVARVINIEDAVGTVKKLLYTLLATVLTTIAVMVTKSVFEKRETHPAKPQATVEVPHEYAR